MSPGEDLFSIAWSRVQATVNNGRFATVQRCANPKIGAPSLQLRLRTKLSWLASMRKRVRGVKATVIDDMHKLGELRQQMAAITLHLGACLLCLYSARWSGILESPMATQHPEGEERLRAARCRSERAEGPASFGRQAWLLRYYMLVVL